MKLMSLQKWQTLAMPTCQNYATRLQSSTVEKIWKGENAFKIRAVSLCFTNLSAKARRSPSIELG